VPEAPAIMHVLFSSSIGTLLSPSKDSFWLNLLGFIHQLTPPFKKWVISSTKVVPIPG
jgi:hypothetical protein